MGVDGGGGEGVRGTGGFAACGGLGREGEFGGEGGCAGWVLNCAEGGKVAQAPITNRNEGNREMIEVQEKCNLSLYPFIGSWCTILSI